MKIKLHTSYALLGILYCSVVSCANDNKTTEQVSIERIANMPDHPQPYKMIDWYEKAHNFDQYIFNAGQKGKFLPFIWSDSSKRNFDQNTFGLYTAVGDVRQGPQGNVEFHEAICTMGSLLGAGLVGIDKTNQNNKNYIKMIQNYFNSENGWNIMMDNTNPKVASLGGGYGRDWWYDIFPNVLFYGICDLFPNVSRADSLQHLIAERFYKADSVLKGNYNYSFFDYAKLQGVSNTIPHQQDAAAGHAYVLLCAYEKFHDPRYLSAAKSAMNSFISQKESRFYEVLMPFGALVAARLNAEYGGSYDIKKILNWTFDGCKANDGRTGWGVIAERWGNYDVHGLQGSITDGGGYAFLMNSFDLAWPLVPMVRYDNRFANAIGKWMLNVANAARLMYPYEIDDEHQWLSEKKQITKNVIAYEGLRKEDFVYRKKTMEGVSPVALGDGPQWAKGQPQESMFSLYSSAQVGIFGSIIRKTNVDQILQINCTATDFYKKKSFPTYLYFNPYDSAKSIIFHNDQHTPVDLYDVLSKRVIVENTNDDCLFSVEKKSSRLIVVLPHKVPVTVADGLYRAGDTVVAYQPTSKN